MESVPSSDVAGRRPRRGHTMKRVHLHGFLSLSLAGALALAVGVAEERQQQQRWWWRRHWLRIPDIERAGHYGQYRSDCGSSV